MVWTDCTFEKYSQKIENKKNACLFNYNVYSNTANSHFIWKYTGVDFMQQQQVHYKSYKK